MKTTNPLAMAPTPVRSSSSTDAVTHALSRDAFTLRDGVTFLNHGSWGAIPLAVQRHHHEWLARIEKQTSRFFFREFEPLLDEARVACARFIGANPDDFAFVRNTTEGVSTVLRSLELNPGDEILATNHTYNACRTALEFVAQKTGATPVFATVPFPLRHPEEVLDAILARVTPRTRYALIDHITSPTGLIFPIADIVAALRDRGIETLVDGAHAPGMLPLDVTAIDAAWYTGNFHKWTCAPKGSAFLVARPDMLPALRPLALSHGANSPRTDRSRFRLEFDWPGSLDPTPWLATPFALATLATLHPDGWHGIITSNRAKTLAARDRLCHALNVTPPAPHDMLGSLAAVALPDRHFAPTLDRMPLDPLMLELDDRFDIQVVTLAFPTPPSRYLRISSFLYNDAEDINRLVHALPQCANLG